MNLSSVYKISEATTDTAITRMPRITHIKQKTHGCFVTHEVTPERRYI